MTIPIHKLLGVLVMANFSQSSKYKLSADHQLDMAADTKRDQEPEIPP